jgi:hypothetical protein
MPEVNQTRAAAMGEAPRHDCERLCNFVRAALASLALTLAAIGAGAHSANAQEAATGPGGIQYFVTPYLWLAGVYTTTQTPLARAPEVNSSVGPFEMLGDLKGAPFMGSAEIRVGPIGLLGDVLHVPVGTNITTRNVFFQGGKAALTTNTGTALVLYRVVDAPNQFADLGIGFRSWGFGANLSLNPGRLPGVSQNQRAGWGDPLIAGRYHYDFGNGFGATAYGDIGGFGLGAHTDWQVMGTVDYALSSWINLHVGYRSLNFNYSSDLGNLGFNVHMRGPIFAGTFRF